MNILHVSKVAGAAERYTNVVFIYHSIEVKNYLLDALANAGYRWSTGRAVNTREHAPQYMPGGIRTEDHLRAYYGSLDRYLNEAPGKYRLIRIVL